MSNKKINISYNKINAMTSDFNRDFDNTVVDTFAFDKVLHSELFSSFLFEKLEKQDSLSEQNLNNIIDQSTSLAIHEVESIYFNTKHRVVKPNVYYDYIQKLVNRIVNV